MRLFLPAIILLFGCQPKTTGIQEKVSINGLNIDKSILTELEDVSGKKTEPRKMTVYVSDPGSESGFREADSVVNGLEIPFVEGEKARALVRASLEKVKKEGNYIYLTNLSFDDEIRNAYYDIEIVNVADQFDLVKQMQTSGINYDVSNDQVVEKLRAWNQNSPFSIITVDQDRIEADFIKLPPDLNAFAADMYEFCPDVIDQGAGSEEELISYFKSEKSFWLWWD
jgi:hypothetical protein